MLALRSYYRFKHSDLLLLLLQYGVILWSVLWYLRSQQRDLTQQGDDLAPPAGLPRLNLFAVISCFALLAIALSWFATRGLVNPDESGYSFQARIYASGRLMADPLIGATSNVQETPAQLRYTHHILRPFGWFTKFPPGWPLVLSLAYLFSVRWLPNAVFGILQLFVITAIGSRWFSREVGAVAALLAVLSPFYLVNSVGMMSHALCALLAATACLALCKALSTGGLRYYTAMFAYLACMFQVRPYTAFVLTLVMTTAALWFARTNRKLLVQVLAVGTLIGALAVAGVLVYNYIYTGRWLVSPYAEAVGANVPPELSLRPTPVLQGMRWNGPFMLLETALGAFLFLHILAAYAIIRENQHRREVWILTALYLSLVSAYLFHPENYAVFFGERFHFEAFFALVLIAARGMQLLVSRWQIRRSGVIFTLLVLGGLQVGQLASTVLVISRLGRPYRQVRAALESPSVSGLVFLHDGPGFEVKHFNLNQADWRHASRVYLVDADAGSRPGWACRFGFSQWTVASYDPRTHMAALDRGRTECPAATVP